MRCSPQKSARPLQPGPWVPKIPRHRHHKVTGCRARRIKQHCGDPDGRWARVWPHGGGRPEVVLSQLLLHVSYVFFVVVISRRIEILSGLSGTLHESNRIESTRMESSRFDCRCRIRRDVGVLCPVAVCCAVSRLPAWENIPSTNPAARQGSLCRNSPAQREPSQPPAHLIDSPATRIATRHRDRFFLGCVIHAGSRGWYLPHDGNNMRRKQTLGRWLAGAGLEWLAGCLTAKYSCYWAVIVTV